MFPKFLTKVEEKYVFSVSSFLWHLFVFIVSLGILAGAFFLISGIIPSSKTTAVKAAYPAPQNVSEGELLSILERKQKNVPVKGTKPVVKETKKVEKPVSADMQDGDYQKAYARIKSLLPPPRYRWESDGYRSYDGTWTSFHDGMIDQFNSLFERVNASSPKDKAAIFNGLSSILSVYAEDSRHSALYCSSVISGDVSSSVNRLNLLAKVAKFFGGKETAAIERMRYFLMNNPVDGADFTEFSLNVLAKFDSKERLPAQDVLIRGYSRKFNDNLSQLKDVTNKYLEILPKVPVENQSEGLGKYFTLFSDKNIERARNIRNIDDKFITDSLKAESDYLVSKEKKYENRVKGSYAIGGGLMIIALIAVFLVLLSIQRYIKRIAEKLGPQVEETPEVSTEPTT